MRTPINVVIIFLLSYFGLSGSIYAASKKSKKPKSSTESIEPSESDPPKATKSGKKSKKAKENSTEVLPDATTNPDQEKSKKELLGTVGMSPNSYIGFGGTIGLIKPTGSGLEATFFYSSGTSSDKAYGASVMHFGGRYRKGFAKLAYATGGLGFRMVKGSWYVLDTSGTSHSDADYLVSGSLNAVTVDAALGAHTHFGKFALTVDLVGISYPAAKFGASATTPNATDISTTDADDQKAKFNTFAGSMMLSIFKLGVGLVF